LLSGVNLKIYGTLCARRMYNKWKTFSRYIYLQYPFSQVNANTNTINSKYSRRKYIKRSLLPFKSLFFFKEIQQGAGAQDYFFL